MALKLVLTDAEIPASPSYIEFLHSSITGEPYHVGSWFKQEDESLATNQGRFMHIKRKAQAVGASPKGRAHLMRSYRFFKELLTGRIQTIREISKYRFYFVIGIPRTGGTYLTKQLFLAEGINYKEVQNALAHDGFPHLAHLSLKGRGGNIHTNGLLQLAEYLAMVEIYFSEHGKLAHKGGIVVPKKFTKAIYYFDLIRELFGTNAEYLLTIRHPLSICQSILDKSGGMPDNGKFALRSAIERWTLDDWLHWGTPEPKVKQMDYVEAFLGYWKRFHFLMGMCGVASMPTTRIVPYGEESMTGVCKTIFKDFGVPVEPEAFKVAKPPKFGKAHEEAAEKAVQDVATLWASLGLKFPVEEISKRY